MSTIYVKMKNVTGGSQNAAYSGHIECLGVQHAISLPVSSGGNNQTRVQGDSMHGPIVLYHHIDKASPVLRQMALGNSSSGEVEISVVRNINGQSQVVETITLTDVKVGRVDLVTLVDQASGEPSGEFVEAFALSYSGQVQWSSSSYDSETGNQSGSMAGGWDIGNARIV